MSKDSQNLRQWISTYRWPIGIACLITLMVGAQATMVFIALSADSSTPEKDYYERAVKWDEELALRESSKDLGWDVQFDLPKGDQFMTGMPRPVDVRVLDSNKAPVSGLSGKLLAVRPSNERMNSVGEFVELPYSKGNYRALLTFQADGLWELTASMAKGDLRFSNTQRLMVGTAGKAQAAH